MDRVHATSWYKSSEFLKIFLVKSDKFSRKRSKRYLHQAMQGLIFDAYIYATVSAGQAWRAYLELQRGWWSAPNRSSQVFDLYGRLPESGGVWYKSRQ